MRGGEERGGKMAQRIEEGGRRGKVESGGKGEEERGGEENRG